jgi:hypothetical protein
MAAKSAKLCLYCENIPESLCAKKTLRYDHQPSFTALKKSASDGCIICQRLIAFSHGTVLKGGESSSDMRVGSPLELRWPSLERVENAVFLVEKSTGNAIVHMELYPVPHEWGALLAGTLINTILTEFRRGSSPANGYRVHQWLA